MAVPTAYDETDLAQFMLTTLGEIAGTLGWGLATPILDEAVNDTLLAYGVSTAADAANIPKVRAYARRSAWQMAVASLSARFDFETDGQKFSRNQMVKAAQIALAKAEAEVADNYETLTAPEVGVTNLRWVHDPYGTIDDTVRVPR